MMKTEKYLWSLLLFILASCGHEKYLSPGAMAVDGDRDIVYTVLTTGNAIAVTDLKSNRTTGQIVTEQNPNDILLSVGGAALYASCGEAGGSVEVFDLPEGRRKASIAVGHTPQGMALSADGKTLYVANRFANNISVVDLSQNREIATIPAVREPRALCLTPDGKTLAAANFLPGQASTDSIVAAQITLIDVPANSLRANIALGNGAQSITGLTCSPDGNYLYAVHLSSQYTVPVTQLDRGWVNTNALSIIDLKAGSLHATVLLDDVDNGAANPAGICIAGDGKLYVALSGTHELMALDLEPLHARLAALFSGEVEDAYIQDKAGLSTSLSFTSPYKKRIPLQGRSPRSVVAAKGSVIASSRFSPFLEKLPLSGDAPHEILPLGREPSPDAVRRGELAFCDASFCYQKWQSCASCHPDGRADGLNWDQQNDGLGNPKNTKSLLFSHATPPSMITGIRKTAEMAVRNGILHTLQTRQPEELARDMDTYLKRMTPVESPYLAEYREKDPQEKGKELYERTGCVHCHNGKYLTDLSKYDVGTGDGGDEGRLFDTPTLREVWRTAPYLYDGRAATMREVLTTFNPGDQHGATRQLTGEELDALILYVYTL
jgi:YVTN family beta-propeller protein